MLHVGKKCAAVCTAAALCSIALCATPVYASSGSDEVEKIESPTVQKEIAEVGQNGALSWGDVADAQVGVEVPYRITGTLPSNWDDFDTYYYEFHDMLDPQLVIDASSVKITIAGGGGIRN